MSASNFVRKLRPLVSVIGLFLISNLLVAFLLSTSPSPLRALSEVTDFTDKNISIVLNAYLLQLLLYEIAYFLLACCVAYFFGTQALTFVVGLIVIKYLFIPAFLEYRSVLTVPLWYKLGLSVISTIGGGAIGYTLSRRRRGVAATN